MAGASTTTPMSLPTEVYEHIIDAVGDEPIEEVSRTRQATLKSCALVCRAWHPRSRQQLFRAIAITTRASLRKLRSVLDAAPWLGSCVESLYIYARRDSVGQFTQANTPYDFGRFEPHDLFLLSIGALQKLLPSLQAIRVMYRDCRQREPYENVHRYLPYIPVHPQSSSLCSSFKEVLSLDIQNAVFATFSDLEKVVGSFQQLRVLRLNNVEMSLPKQTGMNPYRVPRSKLFLGKLQQLQLSKVHYVLTRFLINGIRPDCLTGLLLGLDFSLGPFQFSVNPNLTFERLEKLRKLELDINVCSTWKSRGRSMSETILSILRSWPRSAMPLSLNIRFSSVGVQLNDGKTVAFTVTRQEYLDFLRVCARAVERLSQETDSELLSICVTCPDTPTLEAPITWDEFREMFPVLEKRGGLKPIVWMDPDIKREWKWPDKPDRAAPTGLKVGKTSTPA